MKKIRFNYQGNVHWGNLDGGSVTVLDDLLGPPTQTILPLSDVALLAPCEPKIIVCVGKNYAEHIREMATDFKADIPNEPGLFLKALNTLSSPGDPIPYPNWTENLHYEGELALVIGKTMSRITPENAFDYVLGYTCAIDVTARDRQKQDLQWTRGKSADGFCPLGPWLETDLDVSSLRVQTRVNGHIKQDGNTRDLIFDIPTILSYISQFMTLHAGDVVLTGTPEGVGPLAVGDTIEVEIENIGVLSNTVEAA